MIYNLRYLSLVGTTLSTLAWAGEDLPGAEHPQVAREAPAIRFQPRWSFTGGAMVGVGDPFTFSYGGRIGLRRWHTRHLLSGILFEYERVQISDLPRTSGSAGHLLSLPLRLELSKFTPWTDRAFAIPEGSGYLQVGPAIHLDPDGYPGTGLGWTLSLGGQITKISGPSAFPCFVELRYRQIFFKGIRANGATFNVGVGF